MAKTPKLEFSARETRAFTKRARLDSSSASAFSFHDDAPGSAYAPHRHERHQLIYALEGSATLEAADALYLLPPERAGFIPAGVMHVTSLGNAKAISLFFDRALVRVKTREVRVIDASPLLRELIQFAARWPPSRRKSDRVANAYFKSFGLLLSEWLEQETAYRLPRGKSALVKRAIALTVERSGVIELPELARAAGTSERSLRRHLRDETGLTFRELASTARILRAMELLASRQQSVLEVALAVGFDSPSAFAKRFAQVAGESPSAFRARATRANP